MVTGSNPIRGKIFMLATCTLQVLLLLLLLLVVVVVVVVVVVAAAAAAAAVTFCTWGEHVT
jgi:hypothetical protein